MKEKIRKIHSELNDGRITVSQATEQVLDLLAVSGSAVCTLGQMNCMCQFRPYEDFLKYGCEHYR